MKKAAFVLVFCLLFLGVAGLVFFYLDNVNYHQPVKTRLPEPQVRRVTAPRATPTVEPRLVERLFFARQPVAFTFHLGQFDFTTNWALPWPYAGDNEELEREFDPRKGTLLVTQKNGLVTVKAHSGYWAWQPMFATTLEAFVRVKPGGNVRFLAEGRQMVDGLIDKKTTVCQMGGTKPLAEFENCQGGRELGLVIVAATIIDHDKTASYDQDSDLLTWLRNNYPGRGFETLGENDLILSTCLGQFNDQVSDGTNSFLFNRLALGFKVSK